MRFHQAAATLGVVLVAQGLGCVWAAAFTQRRWPDTANAIGWTGLVTLAMGMFLCVATLR